MIDRLRPGEPASTHAATRGCPEFARPFSRETLAETWAGGGLLCVAASFCTGVGTARTEEKRRGSRKAVMVEECIFVFVLF